MSRWTLELYAPQCDWNSERTNGCRVAFCDGCTGWVGCRRTDPRWHDLDYQRGFGPEAGKAAIQESTPIMTLDALMTA
jgi:hypothetical protein